jgi:hypothetical protein
MFWDKYQRSATEIAYLICGIFGTIIELAILIQCLSQNIERSNKFYIIVTKKQKLKPIYFKNELNFFCSSLLKML